MSRGYRIRVREPLNLRETQKRVVRARDSVSTELEVLEVLPPEQMAGLLAQELQGRGFEKQGDQLVRKQGAVTVIVEPETGTVTVQSETSHEAQVEAERTIFVEKDNKADRARGQQQLRETVGQELDRQAEQETAKLQAQVTAELEAQLAGLAQELGQAVNRVTAEALKQKAAQLGQIKAIDEDPQSGNMTIVVEV